MLAEMELVAAAGFENFKAIKAKKQVCIPVDFFKMVYHILVERGAEHANLRKTLL